MHEELAIDDKVASILSLALRLDGFFPEFKAEHVNKIFPRSRLYAYASGSQVIVQGEGGRDLYVIYSGSVEVGKTFGSAGIQVAALGVGGVFGEIGLLQGGARSATVVTSEDSSIFRLVYEDMSYLLNYNRELAAHLKAMAARRIEPPR